MPLIVKRMVKNTIFLLAVTAPLGTDIHFGRLKASIQAIGEIPLSPFRFLQQQVRALGFVFVVQPVPQDGRATFVFRII
jgi:hypothetical protein